MTEDTGTVEPPDIRPPGRPSHTNTRSRFAAGPLAVCLAAIALLPGAYGNTPPKDDFTSYPPRTRATPILDGLAAILQYGLAGIERLSDGRVTGAIGGQMGRRQLDETGIVEACMIPVLVALSGMFAGLTLGYFSVDQTQLQVLSISGTPIQQAYARKIIPIRKDSHLLLTTLILGNMIVNEALPVVMDGVIGGGVVAVVISTVLVVIFAEIIPQSICSRYGLLIGAKMAFPVRILMYIAMPLAWPIAKLLEWILGAHHGIVYRRSELRELIKMHAVGGQGGGDLDNDTVTIAQGALDLAGKTVLQAMTPIDKVFMLPIEAKLDYETLGHVVQSGHSRVPVYQTVEVPDLLAAPGAAKMKTMKKVIGSLLVKSCVLLDPEDATPLATIPINAIPSVPFDEPLTNMLNVFQEGRSHMAIVSRRGRTVQGDIDADSVMTAAAGGLRQRFMRKVAEIAGGSSGSDTSDSSDNEGDAERGEAKKHRKNMRHRKDTEKKEEEGAKPRKNSVVEAAKLTQLEQVVPADAQLPAHTVEKFFDGLEGAPLGIITLEDVLEELIGEEIYDEYDDTIHPRNAASTFVPREAALAAQQAALVRANTQGPEPAANEKGRPAVNSMPSKRLIPKFPAISKLTLTKRPASQPGRSRTADVHTPAPPAQPDQLASGDTALNPTVIEGLSLDRSVTNSSTRRRGSAPDLRTDDPALALTTILSETNMASSPMPVDHDPMAAAAEGSHERYGRRLSRPTTAEVRSNAPSRIPTPSAAVAAEPVSESRPPSRPRTQDGVLSPVPVHAAKRGKFKSVPTPIATPKLE